MSSFIFFTDINLLCRDFDNGGPLHIACANLCVNVVALLLQRGADQSLLDGQDRTPRGNVTRINVNIRVWSKEWVKCQSSLRKMLLNSFLVYDFTANYLIAFFFNLFPQILRDVT